MIPLAGLPGRVVLVCNHQYKCMISKSCLHVMEIVSINFENVVKGLNKAFILLCIIFIHFFRVD